MARISNEIRMNRRLKFGVEIEFNNDVRHEIASILNSRGVRCYVKGYTHEIMDSWKIVIDSTCGYEIVSPILYDFHELEIVCETMVRVGAKVDFKCGLHVHHDANDLSVENIKNVYRLYNKYEKAIDSVMPVSRRKSNSRWCQPVTDGWLDKVESCDSISDMKSQLANNSPRSGLRYKKLNFCSYLSYGTLEFRQHSGTTNFEKIKNWVLVTNIMLQRSSEEKKVKPLTDKRCQLWIEKELAMMYDLYKELGLNGTVLSNHLRNRKKACA